MQNNFKTRLFKEYNELIKKISKLDNFLYSDSINTLENNQRVLLKIQLSAMRTYGDCLAERLRLLNDAK